MELLLDDDGFEWIIMTFHHFGFRRNPVDNIILNINIKNGQIEPWRISESMQ